MHSLKGAVRMVGFNNIQMIIHKMEDVFDAVNQEKYSLEPDVVRLISKTLETVAKYLQESVRNGREIIDDNYTSAISNIEYIIDVEIPEQKANKNENTDIPDIIPEETAQELTDNQEIINTSFNNCFNIIDGIVPENGEAQQLALQKKLEELKGDIDRKNSAINFADRQIQVRIEDERC